MGESEGQAGPREERSARAGPPAEFPAACPASAAWEVGFFSAEVTADRLLSVGEGTAQADQARALSQTAVLFLKNTRFY